MEIKVFEKGWQSKLPDPMQISSESLILSKDYVCKQIPNPIKQYKVFDSYTDAINHLLYAYTKYKTDILSTTWKSDYKQKSEESLNNHFYEVIRNTRQKMYFDFDCKDGTQIERCHELITLLQDEIINELNQTYKQKASHHDILIFSSSNHQKISYHIVVYTFCVKGTKENKQFYLDVMKRMKPHIQPQEEQYFDNLYKSTQLFRILHSTKIGTTRRKKLLEQRTLYGSHNIIRYEHKGYLFDDDEICDKEKRKLLSMLHQFEDSLIQNTKNCKVIDVCITEKKDHEKIFDNLDYRQEDVELLIEKVCGDTYHIEWNRSNPDYIWLKRVQPSFCQSCNRQHDNENGYALIRPDTKSRANVFYCCRRNDKLQHIGFVSCSYDIEILEDDDSIEEEADVRININVKTSESDSHHVITKRKYRSDFYRTKYRLEPEANEKNTMIHTHTICSRYLPDIAEFMKDIYTCIIKSDLGTGKSTRIREFLKQFPDMSVLFICNRRTYIMDLSSSIERDLGRSLYNYSGVEKKGADKRLAITCVESLHKLDRLYDCIIVDECTSILSQLSAALSQNHQEVKEQFKLQIQKSQYVFFMDANVDNRTFEVLHEFRSGIIYYLKNTFRPRDDYTVVEYRESEIITLIERSIKGNKNIVIVSSTKEYVETVIRRLLNALLQPDEFRIYTGDDRTNIDDLSHVEDVWSKMRCVVYTSTITVGVNFDKDHFDSIFFLLNPQGTIARESYQQSSRVRHMRDKLINVCFLKTHISLNSPYNYIEMIKHINQKITQERNHIDTFRNTYEIKKAMEGFENRLFNRIDVGDVLTHIAVQSEIERVKSKLFYVSQIEEVFQLITTRIYFLTDVERNEITEDSKLMKRFNIHVKELRKVEKQNMLADAAIITDVKTKAEIEQKIKLTNDFVSKEDIESVKKTNLMDSVKEDKRSEVEKDGSLLLLIEQNQSRIRILMNERLSDEELAYKDVMKEINNGKINKSYYLNRKKIVEGIWKKIGIKHSLDTDAVIHQDVLLSNKEYWESIYEDVKIGFGYRGKKEFGSLRNIVNLINGVFKEWSGVKINAKQKRENEKRIQIYSISIPNFLESLLKYLKI